MIIFDELATDTSVADNQEPKETKTEAKAVENPYPYADKILSKQLNAMSPLHQAAARGDLAAVDSLYDPSQSYIDPTTGNTPAHVGAFFPKVIQFFMLAQPDWFEKRNKAEEIPALVTYSTRAVAGITPLHHAAETGDYASAMAWYRRGANLILTTRSRGNYNTALDLARAAGHVRIVASLEIPTAKAAQAEAERQKYSPRRASPKTGSPLSDGKLSPKPSFADLTRLTAMPTPPTTPTSTAAATSTSLSSTPAPAAASSN